MPGPSWALYKLSPSHVLFLLPQGVIDLEALGKKGYSVPKAGTIQVVSCPSPGLCQCYGEGTR